MVKIDREYSNWQARENKKAEDREARGGYIGHGELASMRMWMDESSRTTSRNQTSRRVGKTIAVSTPKERTETTTLSNGASFTYLVFDEASKLSPFELSELKPEFRPLEAYAKAENHGLKRLTGTDKRRIFAAELKRHEKRLQEWEDRMTEQEIQSLRSDLDRELLGFGEW